MPGRNKTPPRLPPPPPLPAARRIFAHVRAFDVACPACGTVNLVKGYGRADAARRRGYNALTGVLTCRGCTRPWYVGLVLWRLMPGAHRTRPADHVPSPSEAAQLRAELGEGWGKDDTERKGARAQGTNLVCWCGADCPAHPKEDEDVID